MVGTVIWRTTGNQEVVEDLAQETFMRPAGQCGAQMPAVLGTAR
jgi:hypothetical protein